jgi:amino acid transporter
MAVQSVAVVAIFAAVIAPFGLLRQPTRQWEWLTTLARSSAVAAFLFALVGSFEYRPYRPSSNWMPEKQIASEAVAIGVAAAFVSLMIGFCGPGPAG